MYRNILYDIGLFIFVTSLRIIKTKIIIIIRLFSVSFVPAELNKDLNDTNKGLPKCHSSRYTKLIDIPLTKKSNARIPMLPRIHGREVTTYTASIDLTKI